MAWCVLLVAEEGSRGHGICPEFSLVFVSPEDLNKITEEGDVRDVEGERRTTSKARAQQRRKLSEGSSGSSADGTEPDSATGELCPASGYSAGTQEKLRGEQGRHKALY